MGDFFVGKGDKGERFWGDWSEGRERGEGRRERYEILARCAM